MPRRMTEIEAELRAELWTVMAHAAETGDLQALERLRATVAGLEPRVHPSLELLIECDLEALRSRSRAVAASVRVWEDLTRRAANTLAGDDPTLLSIRSLYAQYVRRRGEPGDLERGVRMYHEEWARRLDLLGEDDSRTGVAHANYALALRERGGADDLATALKLLKTEALRRIERYGAAHPFTWKAQVVLAQTQVRAAEGSPEPVGRKQFAEEAAATAKALLDSRRRRYGFSDRSTLNAHLVHAQALLVLGRTDEAVPEIRTVQQAGRRRPGTGLDPGWAELLLARSLAADAPAEALGYAEEALRLRIGYYPESSRQVIEARRLVRDLGEQG